MVRLGVYPVIGGGRNGYIVDIQADFPSRLATRIVAPLLPEDAVLKPIRDLDPVLELLGRRYVMVTRAIASIPGCKLKRSVASLNDRHDQVTRALDTLLLEF